MYADEARDLANKMDVSVVENKIREAAEQGYLELITALSPKAADYLVTKGFKVSEVQSRLKNQYLIRWYTS